MKLIKVGRYVINLEEISYVYFKFEYDDSGSKRRKCPIAEIHLKGLAGNLFSGGMVADEHYEKDPLKERILRLFYEDATNLEVFLNQSSNVTLLD